jgi:inorganic pyrophosphatase
MVSNEVSNATDFIGKNVVVTIDRQIGSKHPKWGFTYDVNYGYIDNTLSPDGEELDAYLLGIDGPVEKSTGKVIAVIHRTNDDDDKLVVSNNGDDFDDKTIREATNFQEKFFQSQIIRHNG